MHNKYGFSYFYFWTFFYEADETGVETHAYGLFSVVGSIHKHNAWFVLPDAHLLHIWGQEDAVKNFLQCGSIVR